MSLVHYIIVRRDLPLGVMSAMLVHAAGESGAMYQDDYDGRFRHAIAVVLEAKNELDLFKTEHLLVTHNIPHVSITETGGAYDQQFMAIGVVPCERESVGGILVDFQTLKKLDIPSPEVQTVQIPNETET